MASVAVIWILVRIIAWHSPANVTWYRDPPAIRHAAQPATNPYINVPARLPLAKTGHGAHLRNADRRFLTEHLAGADHVPQQAAPGLSRAVRLPWPYSDAGKAFFLQASLTRRAGGAGDRGKTIPRFPDPPATPRRGNLSAYVWLHARLGSEGNPPFHGTNGRSIANGQYGGSQAGAILSYRLLDRPAPELAVYGRLSAALDPLSQGEIALGARIRPVRKLPLAVHAEQRFDADSASFSGTAFYATGGTGPDAVIERFALETYAQAGYVLGRNETYFFDGAATVQRPLAEFTGRTLSAGAGLWAGGQRDFRRLDVGPRARFDLSADKGWTSIAVDGRIRVAGNARPGSGVALTVSASF